MSVLTNGRWSPYLERYRGGEWRDRLFHDMVLGDARTMGPSPTILDIGCGDGLDGDLPLQRSVAETAGRFIGVEPDPSVDLPSHFTETHRCLFEDAPIAPGSVDVAYAVMVLEHLRNPQAFWDKLHLVLADGGVFWGLTVDSRHPFATLSYWAGRLRVRDAYLNLVLGNLHDGGRYKNYPTFYRSNTPREIENLASRFHSCECVNFSREGQWGTYLPKPLDAWMNRVDRRSLRLGRPGTLLIIRASR